MQCEVPGCTRDKEVEDCCRPHSFGQSRVNCGEYANALPNDGVIDWEAIDIAVQGARKVRLTWVETDISVATLLAQGCPRRIIKERVGTTPSKGTPRASLMAIVDAIRKDTANAV